MKFNLNIATNKQILQKRDELKRTIAEYQTALEATNDELINRILIACKESPTEKSLRIEDQIAILVSRPSFSKVPLEVARQFRALKLVPDGKVLSPLYEKGIQIPGVTTADYLMVKKVK